MNTAWIVLHKLSLHKKQLMNKWSIAIIRKKSIAWFETTWIYFYAEIVQHWNMSKKAIFSSKKCLLRFSVKKTPIRCHVLEIDDDATNRLYMHVSSLSIWNSHTQQGNIPVSRTQCHSASYPRWSSFFSNHLNVRSLTHSNESTFSLLQRNKTLINAGESTRVLRFPVYRKLSLRFQYVVTCLRA